MTWFKSFFKPLDLPPIPPVHAGNLDYWRTGVTKAQAIDTLRKARRRLWRGGWGRIGQRYICFAIAASASDHRLVAELQRIIHKGLDNCAGYEWWLTDRHFARHFTARQIQAGRLAWIDAIIKELS